MINNPLVNRSKSEDASNLTYLNPAAMQTLQIGEDVLYKGGRLSRLNAALKKEQDDGGLRNLLSLLPTNFSVFGDAIYFAKQRELAEKLAAYALQMHQV